MIVKLEKKRNNKQLNDLTYIQTMVARELRSDIDNKLPLVTLVR